MVERRLPRFRVRRRARGFRVPASFARPSWGHALPGSARGNLVRYLVPAVFLLAATAVALVVRSALRSDTTAPGTSSTVVSTRASSARVRPPAASASKRYYVIRVGDTLGGIAARFRTTVDALLRLNPGVVPTALVPGEHVRVK